ncbi:hypothetical protein HY991_00425 [Candidatus Micrarchaeota archaeon]|nr:hypothetical protein [Candidatus Micrarchaeota archaeon]
MGTESEEKAYLLMGLLACSALLIYAELINGYPFLNDDNYSQFLPALLVGLKQLFAGTIPFINMHQIAGTPLLEIGTYPFFYPGTVVSYLISHWFIQDDFSLIEVFVVTHLLLGFVATFYLVKKLCASNPFAFLGGIGASLSGYMIIVSSNWYYAAPTAFFLPLIFLLQAKNLEAPSKRNAVAMGLTRGVYFLSGNVQYFAYSLFFELIFFALWMLQTPAKKTHSTIKRERLTNYILSLAISGAVALPFGLMMLYNTAHSYGRTGAAGLSAYLTTPTANPIDFFFGNLLPYPFYGAIFKFANSPSSFGNIYFTGAIFFLAAILGGILLWRRHGNNLLVKYPFATLALVAALLSFGAYGGLHLLFLLIPIWNKFSCPFKLALYADFFIVLFGVQVLTQFSGRFSDGRFKKMVLFALSVFFLGLMFLQVHYSSKTHFTYFSDRLPLNRSEFSQFADGRTVAYYTNSYYAPENGLRHGKLNHSDSSFMTRNFASYYELYSITGYEPLQSVSQVTKIPVPWDNIEGRRVSLQWLSEWSVKYLFVACDSLKYHPELWNLTVVKSLGEKGLAILKNDEAKSIVFCQGNGRVSYSFKDNGLELKARLGCPANCTASVLYNKNYRLTLNGEVIPLKEDGLGRIVFELPAGESEARLYYENKLFEYGVFLGVVLLLIILLFFSWIESIISGLLEFVTHRVRTRTLAILVGLVFLLLLARDISTFPLGVPIDCLSKHKASAGEVFKCTRQGLIEAGAMRPDVTALNKISTPVEEPFEKKLRPPQCSEELRVLSNTGNSTNALAFPWT